MIFSAALYTFDDDGRPRYNMALCSRAKKNWKSTDLILAGLYRFLIWPSTQGNDGFILANDEDQSADDLSLAKKLIAANPLLSSAVTVRSKEIIRNDDRGVLKILPARDAIGAHGKTYLFIGFDEIHGYRNHDLFEALAPDPTRLDTLCWITSYAGIRHAAGVPLYDFQQTAKRGDDHRMFFSWYAADFTTDPALADAEPEQRANPSLPSWGNAEYLAQQRKRLPTYKYRRLHLNLPGAPDGAAFSAEHVMASIVTGRKHLPPEPGLIGGRRPAYKAFVDMSGGSNDDAVLGIAYFDPTTKRSVLAALVAQTGKPPFNPRDAVRKFSALIREFGLSTVTGDDFGGNTFKSDFQEHGIAYQSSARTTSELYEALEPRINAGEVELLDIPELQEQLLTLVYRGSKIDHQPGDHDDHACAAAGALGLAAAKTGMVISQELLDALSRPSPELLRRQLA